MSNSQPPPNPQQPPPGGYPPPGYYQQGPPPKKKHTVRNVLLILTGLGVLFIGGCAVLFGVAVNEADKAIQEETANDTPTEVTAGEAFEHDGYKIAGGWKVAQEEFGNGLTLENVKVTVAEADEDLPDSGRTALLTFRFYKGNEVLAEVQCSSNEMQVGETSRMDCLSMSSNPAKGYNTIKVSDAF